MCALHNARFLYPSFDSLRSVNPAPLATISPIASFSLKVSLRHNLSFHRSIIKGANTMSNPKEENTENALNKQNTNEGNKTKVSNKSTLSFLTQPRPNINYNFVTYMYITGCGIGILMYILEIFLQQKTKFEENESSLKEVYNSIKGIYLIFMPFFPCLLWCLVLRSKWINSIQKDKAE